VSVITIKIIITITDRCETDRTGARMQCMNTNGPLWYR